MAEYNIISKSIWNSEKFKSLKNNQFAKLVYLYLLNCPHSNSCGCFAIHFGYIMADLNCTESEVGKAIESLSKAYLIEYDYEENTLYIPNFLTHNQPRNPKHAIKVFNDTLSIPSKKMKSACMSQFSAILKERNWKMPDEKQKLLESLSKGYPELETPKPKPKPRLNSTHIDIKAPSIPFPEDVQKQVFEDFIKHRKAKKAPITQTVISRMRQEADKIGWTLEQAMIETCSRGWQGFKADWINSERKTENAKQHLSRSEQADAAVERFLSQFEDDEEREGKTNLAISPTSV